MLAGFFSTDAIANELVIKVWVCRKKNFITLCLNYKSLFITERSHECQKTSLKRFVRDNEIPKENMETFETLSDNNNSGFSLG